jgi:hypothetical protein
VFLSFRHVCMFTCGHMNRQQFSGGPCETTGGIAAASPAAGWAHSRGDGPPPWDQPADTQPAGELGPEHDPEDTRPTL